MQEQSAPFIRDIIEGYEVHSPSDLAKKQLRLLARYGFVGANEDLRPEPQEDEEYTSPPDIVPGQEKHHTRAVKDITDPLAHLILQMALYSMDEGAKLITDHEADTLRIVFSQPYDKPPVSTLIRAIDNLPDKLLFKFQPMRSGTDITGYRIQQGDFPLHLVRYFSYFTQDGDGTMPYYKMQINGIDGKPVEVTISRDQLFKRNPNLTQEILNQYVPEYVEIVPEMMQRMCSALQWDSGLAKGKAN